MKDPYFNQCIVCKVKNCKFYKNDLCTLSKIIVNNNNSNAKCASFKEIEK